MHLPSPSEKKNPPPPERRDSPRRAKQIQILVADAEPGAIPATVWLLNRSVGGLCLSVPESVSPGTILNVRPGILPDLPWVAVEVKSCRKVETTWELGCEFLREPSYSVLVQFG